MGLKNKFLRIIGFISLLRIRIKRQLKGGLRLTSEDKEYSQYDIGRFTYGTPLILDYGRMAKFKIGRFCSIASNVKILLGGEHDLNSPTTYPLKSLFGENIGLEGFSKGDVIIGNDVWIGYGATILSGVKIGDGAVIGSGAVVAKSVEPYSIVVGNPARELRKRFEDSTIKKLLKIKWWDWDIKKIRENMDFILGDVNLFIKKFG